MRSFGLVGLLFCLAAVPAFGDAVSNIQLMPGTNAAMQFGQNVEITFDYEIETAGGVRIWARPYSQGSLTSNYGASGSPIYPEGPGIGTATFTILSEEALVDDIRFQIWTADQSAMILEFYFPVSFYFSEHAIYNVFCDPMSPSAIKYNQDIDISFEYGTSNPGDVRIWARPMTNGGLTPNYGASGSPAYPPGSGMGNAYFHISSGPVIVDQIRFQMQDDATSDLLLEFYVPVTYDIQAASAFNIFTDPPSPVGWLWNDDITVHWEYAADEDVRIWARPMTNGNLTPNYGASGSPIYPAGTGMGSGTFTITSGEVTVDEIFFRITDAAQTTELAQFTVPCNIHFSGHPVMYFYTEQVSPAYFTVDHNADIDFTYYTTEPTGVRIWSHPYSNGNYSGYYQGSPFYPPGYGMGETYVGSWSPVVIDELLWIMMDDGQTQTLMEWFVPVELHYGNGFPSSVAPNQPEAIAQAMFEKIQNPLSAATTLRYLLPANAQVTLRLFDVEGREVSTLVNELQTAGPQSARFDTHNLDSGIYFARLDVADLTAQQAFIDTERLVILK